MRSLGYRSLGLSVGYMFCSFFSICSSEKSKSQDVKVYNLPECRTGRICLFFNLSVSDR